MDTRIRATGAALATSAIILAMSASAVAQSEASPTVVAPPEPFTAWLACGQDAGLNEASVKLGLEDDSGTSAFEFPRTIWRFPTLQVSDPRMGGSTYNYLSGTEWTNADWDDEISVFSALWHVVNDGGEWIGPYSTLRSPEIGYATNAIRLEGHGGYEGLYAIIQADFLDDCGWDVTGYILERDMPPFPEPEAALQP